jgi:hypothetical protein
VRLVGFHYKTLAGRLCGIRTQNGQACTSILPFYFIATLHDDSRNYGPKYVVETAINKKYKIIYGVVGPIERVKTIHIKGR